MFRINVAAFSRCACALRVHIFPAKTDQSEALPLNKSQLASLDFMVNRFFMKLFKTTDMQVVKMFRKHFEFVLTSLQLDRRRRSFVGSPFTTDLIKFVFV